MPELPEVETIARGLASRVTGDVIESVWLGSKPEPLKSPAAEIAATLDGRRIASVRRVGKHIVLDLVSDRVGRAPSPAKKLKRPKAPPKKAAKHKVGELGNSSPTQSGTQATAQWIVHLGMTGRLLVCQPDAELAKHTHAVVKLASGKELRFVDPRRFGRLSVAHGFEATGSEPLEVQLDHFVSLFRGRKTPIKSALLNQKLLRAWATSTPMSHCFVPEFGRAAAPHRSPRGSATPLPRSAESIARGDFPGRILGFRLRGLRWRRGILPAAAPSLWPGRRTVPGMQDPDQARSNRGPQQPLLSEMSKVAPPSRRLSRGVLPPRRNPADPNAARMPTSIIHNLNLPSEIWYATHLCLTSRSESISAGPTSASPP